MRTTVHSIKIQTFLKKFLSPLLILTFFTFTAFADPNVDGGTLEGGPFEFCVDGTVDNVSGITLSGNSGTNNQWIVTDLAGTILGLPPMPGVVDFDGAGAGVCLIWNIAYEDGLIGLEADANVSGLEGCFDISNAVYVYRSTSGAGCDPNCEANGGTIEGGPFEFCVDGEADNVSGITLTGNTGTNNQWVVTDQSGTILGLPPMPGAVDFDEAGPGICLIWNIAYEDGLTGLETGSNISSGLDGCYSISNEITVIRNQTNGGILAGGPFEFDSVGDGEADMIPAGSIILTDNQGENSQWIVTDDEGYILGLPPMPGAVDFDGAGPGTCLIWHLSYDGDISGLEMGKSANELVGDCFALSNSIEVIRTVAGDCQANGGELFGGPFEFDSVGDGEADMIPAGSITVANSQGENSQWIVTDDEGYILGLPPMPGAVDFDGAGPGTCLIWYLRYDGDISGLEMGKSANELVGDCFALSNSIEVIRTVAGDCQANGGELFGGPFEFDSVGDGEADMIPSGSITVANSQGENSQWIVTDDEGYILGLPPMPGAVDFDGAGPGTCLIWYLRYDGDISGLEMGKSANELVGDCFALSNSIEVIRTVAGDCQANGGELFGGPFEFDSVGDGEADMIPAGSITVANSQGENSQWIVTDDEGYILGLPPMPGAVDFDGAGPGTCLIWYLRYDGDISGLEMGKSANELVGDCFALSNSIEVIRTVAGDCQANGGELFGGPFEFCAEDGVIDTLEMGAITLANSQGENSQWVITDESGMILGLPGMPSDVDFETAGVGVCLVWNLSYEEGLVGLESGANTADLEGCYSFSNSVEVVRSNSGEACTTATDEELVSNINIYPNPTSNVVNVDLGNAEILSGIIEISDYQGRALVRKPFDNSNSSIVISTDELNNGIYILSIRTNENYVSRKLIVSK